MWIWDKAPAPLELCPTPTKKKYPDKETALRKIQRLLSVHDTWYSGVYHCVCGWWHLTTKGHRRGNSTRSE